jgi:transposase
MSKQSTRVRRSFTPQFKRDAVALVQQGKSVTEVAHSLGIARSLLQRWKEQLESKKEAAFPGNGNVGSERERMRALEKELRDVREERDILKKALAYFAAIRSEVSVRRGAPGDLPHSEDVRGPGDFP